ncbi:MAG: hypothetical protein GF309_00285 [Candidatus Lokiarchaeota archaeon]|nr:hypothetical protein [Candidatus Lokiarchaeota archaeon]
MSSSFRCMERRVRNSFLELSNEALLMLIRSMEVVVKMVVTVALCYFDDA